MIPYSSHMRILVIGAGSYVGARLYLDLVNKFGKESVIGTYHSKQLSKELVALNVTDAKNVAEVIASVNPNIIVDVVAMASPRWCEEHPKEALEINQKGTENILKAAYSVGARIIYISTTGVLNPTDVYRKTKLASEETVKHCKAGFVIIRPGLIQGFSPNTENDRPFNRILKNLDQKTPAVYDTSWKANVTWIGHISELVIISIERNLTGEIINVFSPDKKSRFDIASDILSKFGITVTPKDDHDKTTSIEVNLDRLKELNLPSHTYNEIIAKIVDEIKHREKFTLA